MSIKTRLEAIGAAIIFCAGLNAQQTPSPNIPPPNVPAPGGPAVNYQQRLNTVVRKADDGAAQMPAGPEVPYDPLAFYRKNPELMKRYFPHLYQPTGGPGTGGVEREGGGRIVRDTEILESFKFGGGTAQELVDALKANFQPAPNVMIAPKSKATRIPEFELQNVTLADLFQALNNLSEDKTVQWQLSGSTEPIWVLNPTGAGTAPGSPQQPFPGRYGVAIPGIDLPGQSVGSQNTCRIIPVGKYLGQGHYKIEDITTAVKTAWSMMGDDAGAQLKYHTDTKLLIAVGSAEQVNVLMQVLTALDADAKHEATSAGGGASAGVKKPF